MDLDNRLCEIRPVPVSGFAIKVIRGDGQRERCLEIPVYAVSVRSGYQFYPGDYNPPADMAADKRGLADNLDCGKSKKTNETGQKILRDGEKIVNYHQLYL